MDTPQIGDIWQDCDKRMRNRRGEIVSIDDTRATLKMGKGSKNITKILLRRMKPGSTGWMLVLRPHND